MAYEERKDFNAMLHDSKDMPKLQIVTDEKTIKKYGGERMYFAPPIDYDRVMKRIPAGKLTTVGAIRDYFARENDSLLVLEEMSGEELICKINYKQGYWCIKSFGAVPVYVIRGIVKKRINGKGIILENGDKILILNSEFKFTN